MKENAKEIRFGGVSLIVGAAAILLAFFTYMVLDYNNERNAFRAGEMLVNQMCSVLEKNQNAEKLLLDSLKDEYVIRANAVAYMVDNQPEAEFDVAELKKMAELMSIDEIHLFDETGRIYSGTRPQYYGFSFDSGEQIAYFKPMLDDKTLSMCQDVEPNTAEGREMMYAITWNRSGDKMIQVGIEPVRLLAELKSNEISNVVAGMPVYQNLEIYVADADTGEILGSTTDQNGLGLQEIGIAFSDLKMHEISSLDTVVNGMDSICSILKDDRYVIAIVQSAAAIRKDSVLPVILIVVYLAIALTVILAMIRRVLMLKKEQMEQLMVLTSMSGIYYSMHLIDLKDNSFIEYSAREHVKEMADRNGRRDAEKTMKDVMHATIAEEFLEQGLRFTDLSTLSERLEERKTIYMDLLGKHVGWIRMSFIAISRDANQRAEKVICTTQIIDEEKRREARLIMESNTDRLTHCLNRRAYETDLQGYREALPEENFIFISMDVNGLKTVNDTMGHVAGDELLSGASECMQRCFGAYGKVYRVGGDEFAAIIFATEDKLKEIKEDFENTARSWSGELIRELSVACGYAAKRECGDMTVQEMVKLADKRMYEEKAKYYQTNGRDRRRTPQTDSDGGLEQVSHR